MKIKRFSAIVLALALAVCVMAGCGKVQQGQSSGGSGSSGVVTLEFFSMPSGKSGLMEGHYWTDILEKEVGVKIELIPGGGSGDQTVQKLQTYMASKSLPDVVVFTEYRYVINAVEAGFLLNFDDLKDKLPNVYANLPGALQYSRDQVAVGGFGDNGLYSIPCGFGDNNPRRGQAWFGPSIRWDYYKELGYPVMKDYDDLLDVLEAMVTAHPTNEDGKQNYGLSLFTGWDNWWPAPIGGQTMTIFGRMPHGCFPAQNDQRDWSVMSMFDVSSDYYKAIRFWYEGNQRGILDVDTQTQTDDDCFAKFAEGRVMYSPWSWGGDDFNTPENMEAGKGYKGAFLTDQRVGLGVPAWGGSVWQYSISKDAKNVDKILEYFNFAFSHEGAWLLFNGYQGGFWDLDANGEPYTTEAGWNSRRGLDAELDYIGAGWNIVNTPFYQQFQISPIYKRAYNGSDWFETESLEDKTALEKDWIEHTGCVDDVDYITKNNMIINVPSMDIGTPPDDILEIQNRIGAFCAPQSWKCIFAKNDAEFDALWTELQETADGMGQQKVIDWFEENYKLGINGMLKYDPVKFK